LVISLQELADLFGFLHFGGQSITVPAEEALLGKQQQLGTTYVVIPRLPILPLAAAQSQRWQLP
jgi:hypothetical protein